MTENWREHPDISGVLVSDAGGVRRADGRLVRVHLNDKGYERVNVGNRSQSVHVLVLETFVGPRLPDHEADHINGKHADNQLANLRWLPRYENRSKFGPANHATKLTADDVRDIRAEAAAGAGTTGLARRYRIDPKNVRLIVRRETWKHV